MFSDECHIFIDSYFLAESFGVDGYMLLTDWFEVADGVGEAFFEAGHECEAGGGFSDMLFGGGDVDGASLFAVVVVVVISVVVISVSVSVSVSVFFVDDRRSAFHSPKRRCHPRGLTSQSSTNTTSCY